MYMGCVCVGGGLSAARADPASFFSIEKKADGAEDTV